MSEKGFAEIKNRFKFLCYSRCNFIQFNKIFRMIARLHNTIIRGEEWSLEQIEEFKGDYWHFTPTEQENNVIPEPIIIVVPQKQLGLERLNNFYQQEVEEAKDDSQEDSQSSETSSSSTNDSEEIRGKKRQVKRIRSFPKNQIRGKKRQVKTITMRLLMTRDRNS